MKWRASAEPSDRVRASAPVPGIAGCLAGCIAVCIAVCVTLAGAGCTPSGGDLLGEHMSRGDQAVAEARYAEAMVAYAHAHEIAPQDARVQRGMMRARVGLMADSPARIAADALEDVRYEAQLLLGADASDPAREAVDLTALANVLVRRGDAEGARAKLAEALKDDPRSASAHAALGLLLAGRAGGAEARAEARAELEAALRTRPASLGALIGMGQIDLAGGDAGAAAERLTAALRIGEDFSARMLLGNARLQQQKPGDAAEQFQRAAQMDPRSAEAASGLGQALLAAGKLDEAEQALRAALQIRQDPPTVIALGFVLARQKRADQALGVFGQVLAQDATSASALYGAGVASEDLGRAAQALDYYGRLLALPPEGRQKQALADLRPDAQGRVTALTALVARAATSSSASASASRPPSPPPGPPPPIPPRR